MKTTKTLVTAGLILSLTFGMLTATANAGSMVEAALKLAALEKAMDLQLRRAPSVNRKLVNYASLKKGKKVGNGQCTDLVNKGLNFADARPGSFSDYRNYVWGEKRPAGSVIRSGDIIQFEECNFVTTTKTANGGTSTSTSNMDHHTSIVRAVFGTTVVLLHQNLDGSPVKQTVLNLSDMKAGRYTVWAPIAK